MRKKIVTLILSFIFSISITIGNSFISLKCLSFLKNFWFIIFIVLFILFYLVINYLFRKIDQYKMKEETLKNKYLKIFDQHPFLCSFIILFICWLPYMIAFYPAILSPDPSFQIMQYFQIDNKYSEYVVLLGDNIITNHHPVVHTMLLGTCIKFGLLFKSTNIGLFLYSIIQITVLASVLSYTIKFMKENKVSMKYRVICLFVYAFVPVFPFYGMSPVKDTIFGSLIILYIIRFYKLIVQRSKLTVKDMLLTIGLMLFIFLFRNNGIHVLILSFPVLFFINRRNLLKYIVIFLVVICSNFLYNKAILPYFEITPTSIREVLSIPFQQTARYVKTYPKEVVKKEKKTIDKVLTYDDLAKRYKPQISDPVKNKFNRNTTKKELKEYFYIWFEQFKKHPKVYIDATLENTYGYVYPFHINWYIYCKFDDRIVEKGFNYHYNDLTVMRTILSVLGIVFPFIPILGLIVNIGFNSWLIFFMIGYLIYKKKYKEVLFLLSSMILLLICFASPVNNYFRYALPNVFAMPLLISIFLIISRGGKE